MQACNNNYFLKYCRKQNNIFYTVFLPHHEDIACVGHLAPHVEQLQQIVELSVDVPTYCYRRSYELNVVLFHQYFLNLSSPNEKDSKRRIF